MTEFDYTVTDPVGIHARPAGQLVRKAGGYSCDISVALGGRSANAKKLFALMGLGVKCGDRITVRCDGSDETSAAAELEDFFRASL